MKRTFWKRDLDGSSEEAPADAQRGELTREEEANLVSSLLEDGRHAPALDLDVPARLVPSSTEGHAHLYIDVPMTWEQYQAVLRVLGDVGILESGFVAASLAREASMLRKPGVKKEDPC